MACAFHQRVQADDQGVATALDEPAHHHQRGDDAEDHPDAELEEPGAEQAESDPEGDAQAERRHLEDDRRAEDDDGCQRQANGAGEHRGAPGEQQPDQYQQRDQQVPALLHRGPGTRALVFRQALETGALGFQVDHPEHRAEVQQRRNQRGLGDLDEGHVDGLGHDEGHRTHHRRHDLAAHRGRGLDAAGEGRAIAEALHQRDGELAGGDHVGHAGTGDGAHQCRGHHRHLGRAAQLVAEQAHGEVGEQLDHARLLEERAEQDEQEDVGRRNVGRRAVQAFGAERQLVDDLIQVIAAVREITGQVLAEQAVGEEQPADDRQRNAHDAACGLEHQHDQRQADHHVGGGHVAGALDQVRLEIPLVEEGGETGQAEHPGHWLERLAGAARRVAEKHQQQQETDVTGAQHLAGHRVEGGGDDLIDGEQQGDVEQRPRPFAGAGMQPLAFAHGYHSLTARGCL